MSGIAFLMVFTAFSYADQDGQRTSWIGSVVLRTDGDCRTCFTAVVTDEPTQPPLPTSQQKRAIVADIESRIADWIKEAGDTDGDWVADRARLEMQLATARLELAIVLLVEGRAIKDLSGRKAAVMETLKLVQHSDRTLDRVNIERLDDFDRRAYRGLTAMRHRVSSLQIHALLNMAGETAAVAPMPPTLPPGPVVTPAPYVPAACRWYRRVGRR